jgi:hypothetical protein
MGCKTIVDPVGGYGASVSPTGSLHVTVDGMPSAPVEGAPVAVAGGSVTTTRPTVGTASSQIVASNGSRRQIDIQNLDATNAIFILLADSGSAATTHFRIGPRERFSFPSGVTYTGAIRAISENAAVAAVVHEYNR